MTRAIAAVLLIVACTPAERDVPARPDSSAAQSAPQGTTVVTPRDTTAREIYIDSVVPGNPVIVYGRARTFENVVQVRIRTPAGDSLAQTHTMSVGEMGHHNPFTIQLPIARDPGPRIVVEAFEYSAKDGSIRSLVSREVPYAFRKP